MHNNVTINTLEELARLAVMEADRPNRYRLTHHYGLGADERTRHYQLELVDRNSWRSSWVVIPEELAERIKPLFPNRYGETATFKTDPALTLKRICKELGVTDINTRVTARKQAREIEAARNSRNYHRRNLQRTAGDLIGHMRRAIDDKMAVVGHVQLLGLINQIQDLADQCQATIEQEGK